MSAVRSLIESLKNSPNGDYRDVGHMVENAQNLDDIYFAKTQEEIDKNIQKAIDSQTKYVEEKGKKRVFYHPLNFYK